MTDTPKLNLRQKLIQIYEELDHVDKAGDNKKQGYKFVRAADVMRPIRKALAKLGVYAETNYDLLGTYDIKTNSGGTMHTATVRARIRLLDADSDEVIFISGLGDGADGGDKGIFKAQTGATKNALRNGTLLPDEADPEADETVDEKVAGTSDLGQDEQPDFQEARHVAPKPAATQKAKAEKERPAAAPAAKAEAPQFDAGGPPNVQSTQSPVGGDAAPNAGREPGDDDDDENAERPPTEEELTGYRAQFSKLGDELSTDGKLKSSKGLPINRKLLIFLLNVTQADDAKNITVAQWEDFFIRVAKVKGLEDGLVGLAKLVNKANGVEEKPKK